MWDRNNTPRFEEPTSSLVTVMLVTVSTPLLDQSHHSIGYHSELVGHGYVGHGWHPSFFGSKPPLHRPPLRVLEPRKGVEEMAITTPIMVMAEDLGQKLFDNSGEAAMELELEMVT
uniref:Uncharacterized protein n=1 Tax=Tanacetum cinerariifolium TaxID=118510 RepID=A0A6L2M4A1_TANCI|nr:hypothetical protein [Tanacetum cinerariifolium]